MQIFASYRNVSLKFARRSKLRPARAPTCGAFIILCLFVALLCLRTFGRRDSTGDIERFLNCDTENNVDAKYVHDKTDFHNS